MVSAEAFFAMNSKLLTSTSTDVTVSNATATIFVRGARQLLTLRGAKGPRRGAGLTDLGIILDGSVLIEEGVLREAGPTRRVENLAAARGAIEINAAGRVVMPGFVDSHTHLVFPPPEAGPAAWSAGLRAVETGTAERLARQADTRLQVMARHGATTVEVKTGCGLVENAERKLLRVLESLRNGPVELVSTFLFQFPPGADGPAAGEAAESFFQELLPKIRRRRLAAMADVVWDANPAFHGLFARYLGAARELGLLRKVHAQECPAAPAIATALEHSAASVDHLERATARDIEILAGSPIVATLLPSTALQDAGRPAPARALIDAGAAVALASNYSPHCSPALNMQAALATAAMRLGMTAAEAISAATINGAHALGCAERVGSLEVKKSADVLVLNVPDYRELAEQVGNNLIHTTIKSGRIVYREGEVQ